jgi:Ca-activated chloride channel family protein
MKRSTLLFMLFCAVPGLAQINVRIEAPTADQPIFGDTTIAVRVLAAEPIDRVEIFMNDQLIGVTRTPPYKLTVSAGDDNIQREFRAVAHSVSGAVAAASVVTVPVQIMDEMTFTLRTLFASVSRSGKRDLSLTSEQFRVLDNGVEQEVVTFGRDELPLTAVLLLDTSQSMKGDALEAVRRGAKAFIDGMKPLDEAMVMRFSDRLLQHTAFTADKAALARDLGEVAAEGGTAVNDYLYVALKALEAQNGQRVVVLFSDGSDVHSVLSAADALWKARTGQALIYWIRLEAGKHKSFVSAWRDYPGNDREYDNLEKAVEESGGRVAKIARVEELEEAFRDIMRELREQYAIGYYPSNAKGDGSWHKVELQVRGLGRVRTREGYVDQ